MDTTPEAGAVRAGPRQWAGLAVLALPTLLLSLDMSVLYLALPHLSAELDATATQQLWITDIYGFLIAGFLVTMGGLGDLVGRRKLLLIGAACFTVASVAAAYSSSAEMLIVSRALLGVAGATLMPSTMALLGNMFPDPRQMGTAIAVWMSCFMGGMALGPLVGGLMLQRFWWGSVFLLAIPSWRCCSSPGRCCSPSTATPRAGVSTWPAWRCPWPPSCRSSTASRSSPSTAGSRSTSCPSRWGSSSASSSCAGSGPWRRRSWTCACSRTARSGPPWWSWCWAGPPAAASSSSACSSRP